MAELKTKKNKVSVSKFINAIENENKRKDAKALLKIFKEATGLKAEMWGTSIIGFGSYHYESERSTQKGEWPLTGFSPRKTKHSLYIMAGFKSEKIKKLLDKLGKHKTSVSCLYINKLDDVDTKILSKIIKEDLAIMKKRYNVK